jgi:hypothetical protein
MLITGVLIKRVSGTHRNHGAGAQAAHAKIGMGIIDHSASAMNVMPILA